MVNDTRITRLSETFGEGGQARDKTVKVGDTKVFGTIPYRLLKQGITRPEAIGVAERRRQQGDWAKIERVTSRSYRVWVSAPIGVSIPPTYDTEKDLD